MHDDDHEDAILDALRAPAATSPAPRTTSPTHVHVTLPHDAPMPRAGDAIRVTTQGGDALTGRMRRALGQRRVEIACLSPISAPITHAEPISPAAPARFPAPSGRTLDLRGAQFVTGDEGLPYEPTRPATFSQIEPRRPAALTGVEALDLICPIPLYGLTLIVDMSEDARAFDALCERLVRAPGLSPARTIHRLVTPTGSAHDDPQTHVTIQGGDSAPAHFLALRAMASWMSASRDHAPDQIAITSLPTWGAVDHDAYGIVAPPARRGTEVEMGEVTSWIGAAFASTRGATITTLCRLPLSPRAHDLGLIIDTLSMGGADALVVIDERGRLDPLRSSTKATQPPERQTQAIAALAEIARARRAESHGAIFGIDELGQHGEDGRPGADPDRWRPCLRT